MSLPVVSPASPNASPNASPSTLPVQAGQFLSFVLGSEEYAVEVLSVREIRGAQRITRLPDRSSAMRGVINLRGVVLPVLDLRELLGLPPGGNADTSVMVVIDNPLGQIGLIVDSVSDVLQLAAEQLSIAPDMGSGRSRAIRGIASVGERMLLLLDLDQLVAEPALISLPVAH
jgi:purine-binding chemotaxis protein CheW